MRNFILGTDWWTDCDDVVAMRLLTHFIKKGDICLKGIGINGCMEHSVQSLEGFLNCDGIKDIPIGIDLDATDFGGRPPYQERLAQYCKKYKSNNDADNAVRLYRKLLSESDSKIEIIEIGYLQVIANVLESEGDDISPLSGIELIRDKVSKIWVMAGKWSDNPGKENNFARNERSRKAGSIFCKICPVPVTFLGWEVGNTVITGDNLQKGDPLYDALCDHGSQNGRMSWDPMLILLAIIGDEEKAGYDVVEGTASVDVDTGENTFEKSQNGLHKYVVKNKPDSYYKDMINELIKR